MNPISEQFRKFSIGLKIFVIALSIYGLAILGGYLLSIILIIRGGSPTSFVALAVNLVIFIILMWVFLLQRKKSKRINS
jgi:divalent metal cation (Fe/Co/Zn/Cd) transporter